MSIQSELSRLSNAKSEIKAAIESKGVVVPEGAKLDAFPALVQQIAQGGPNATLCANGEWSPGDQYRIARAYTSLCVAGGSGKNETLTFSRAKKVKISAKMRARNCTCTLQLDGKPIMTLNGPGGGVASTVVTDEVEVDVNVGSVLSASGASLGGDSYFLTVAEVFET